MKHNLLASKRNYGLDILKIISCIAVIGLHTFSRTGEMAYQICFLCCGFAIPTFFIVNGYLILRTDIVLEELIKEPKKYRFEFKSAYRIVPKDELLKGVEVIT